MLKYFKFEKKFREIFLDIWYEINPKSYMEYYEETNADGNEMMNRLGRDNHEFFFRIYQLASKRRTEQ